MLDHKAVEKEILDFIGEDGFEMLKGFYKKYHNVFPLVVEDNIPISINLYYGKAIRNHINEIFKVVPNEIKDWGTYEDYIYNMIVRMIKESESK